MTLRRKTCDRVKSCLAQIKSMVARIVFGRRKAVAGSDIFNVTLLIVVNNGIYDVISFHLCSGNETPYRLRKQVVEPVFGQIKQARGFRQFLLRGVKKVRAEWAVICTTTIS